MNLAGILRGQRIFVEGVGFVGTTNKVEPPKVEFEVAEVAGREVDSGLLKPLSCTLEVTELNPVLWSAVQKRLGETATFTIKRSVANKGAEKQVYFEVTGWVKTQGGGDGDIGKEDVVSLEISVQGYKLEIDGKEMYDIDIPNDICKIDGKDNYETLRKHIG